ncbi:VOC family protein [Demequina sp. SO4-13]|uniref:VOC family protein n=1 Tax=Demequina sp. SO4-13 TaxID=3401027 RepID=UPI003AF84E10
MTIRRLENIGIVVEDLAAAVDFFEQLGLTLLGEATVEGDWVDRVVGLDQVRSQVAMLQTADGHGRLELMRFARPTAHPGEGAAPANTLGIRRIAFDVDDLDATVAGLNARGAELVGEVVRFQDAYRLCYVRGPEGIIVMLSEELGDAAAGDHKSDAPAPD